MKKRILSYRIKIDSILLNTDEIPLENWNDILQEHLVQIGFFQHELLIPYIMHYYTLENEVQKMYDQYDRILEYIRRGKRSKSGEHTDE